MFLLYSSLRGRATASATGIFGDGGAFAASDTCRRYHILCGKGVASSHRGAFGKGAFGAHCFVNAACLGRLAVGVVLFLVHENINNNEAADLHLIHRVTQK